jgi:hypothetical protein
VAAEVKIGRRSVDKRADVDRREPTAEEWLSEFRPIRPDALTAADRDAAVAEEHRVARQADARYRDREQAEPDQDRAGRTYRGPEPDRPREMPHPGQPPYPGQQAYSDQKYSGPLPHSREQRQPGPRGEQQYDYRQDGRDRPGRDRPGREPRADYQPDPRQGWDRRADQRRDYRPDLEHDPRRTAPGGQRNDQWSGGDGRPTGQRDPRQVPVTGQERGFALPPGVRPEPEPRPGRDFRPEPESRPRREFRPERGSRRDDDFRYDSGRRQEPDLRAGPDLRPEADWRRESAYRPSPDARYARDPHRDGEPRTGHYRDADSGPDLHPGTAGHPGARSAADYYRDGGDLSWRPPAEDVVHRERLPYASPAPAGGDQVYVPRTPGGDQIYLSLAPGGDFPHPAAGRADAGPDGPGRTVLDHPGLDYPGLDYPGPRADSAERPTGIPLTGLDPSAAADRVVDEDDEPTSPLPVILRGATAVPRPEAVDTPRGFFEAARPTVPGQTARSASITGSVEPPPPVHYSDTMPAAPGFPASAGGPGSPANGTGEAPGRPIPEAASAKLEQIKDLYLTAEAIGEDALDKHFDQVSQRQRELIREFFERSGPGAGNGS